MRGYGAVRGVLFSVGYGIERECVTARKILGVIIIIVIV